MPRALVLVTMALGVAGCPADLSHWRQGADCGDGGSCPPGQTCAADGLCLARCTGAGTCEPDSWNPGTSLACQPDGLCHFSCSAAGDTCAIGTTCNAATGLCRSTSRPEILAPIQGWPISLAVDATSVYWTTNGGGAPGAGTVMKVALAGGTPVTLASGQDLPQDLVVDATSVYYIKGSNSALAKVPLGGGTPVTLASAQASPRGLAVDAASVYWTTGTGGGPSSGVVMKVALAGGTPVTLASGQNQAGDLAVDATGVYFTTTPTGASTEGAVWKVPLTGGTPVHVASAEGTPLSLALDATSVYWMAGDESAQNIVVWKAPSAGGAPVSLASVTGKSGERQRPAVDATHVYYGRTTTGPDGMWDAVVKVPIGGGAEVVLASQIQNLRGSIAVDGTSVYFFASQGTDDPSVMRVPK